MPPTPFTYESLKKNCDHVDPDIRVMILRDFCDFLRSGNFSKFSEKDEAIVVDVISERFTGFERVKDVQSEAIRSLDLIIPLLSPPALLKLTESLVSSTLTVANTYIKEQRVTSDNVPILRENGCSGLRMILKRAPTAFPAGPAATSLVTAILGPLLAALPTLADEPARRDLYEVIQPVLQTMGTSISSATVHAQLYAQVRRDWECKTTHLFGQLVAVNAALFPVLPEDQFRTALEQLLRDLNTTRGEAFRRNLTAFIAVIRSSSARVGDKVPELFTILNRELDRLKGSSSAEDDNAPALAADPTEDDEARAAILDSLRVLVRDCPKEAGPFLANVTSVGTSLLTWDPNFLGDEADGHGHGGADSYSGGADAYGDGGEDDEYAAYYGGGGDYDYDGGADDGLNTDDFSWKVRLSSAALLIAVVSNPSGKAGAEAAIQQLLCGGATSLLAKALGDRVETVRLEAAELLAACLEYTGTERPISHQAALTAPSFVSAGLALGRGDAAIALDTVASAAALFVEAAPSLVPVLSAGLSAAGSVSAHSLSESFAKALRKLLLVCGVATALASVPTVAPEAAKLLADASARRSAAAVLPIVLQTLRYLAALERATAHQLSSALTALVPSVLEATTDKTAAVARAAIELAAEIAPSFSTGTVFAALTGLLGSIEVEVRTVAVASVARIVATASVSAVDSAVLGKALDSIAALLAADSTRHAAAAAVRVIAGNTTAAAAALSPAIVERLTALLLRGAQLASRQDREASLSALSALIDGVPASVPAEAYAAATALLCLPAESNTLLSPHDLSTTACGFALAAAIARSKNANSVADLLSKAVPRMLSFLANPSAQGLPVVEASKAFFALTEATGGATLETVGKAAFNPPAGNIPVVFGAAIAADAANLPRRDATVQTVVPLLNKPATGPSAAAVLGELGRFADLTAFPSATAALFQEHFCNDEVAQSVVAALAKGTTTQVGKALFARLVAAGTSPAAPLTVTRALRLSVSEGRYNLAAHPLADPAVFDATLAALAGAATAAAQDASEALGQLAAWNAPAVTAALKSLLGSGKEETIAGAGYALRFALRGGRGGPAAHETASLVKTYLGLVTRPGNFYCRRNALLLAKEAVQEGTYAADLHAAAFPLAVSELAVDTAFVKITDLGVVKHREDSGTDLRRLAFDLVRAVMASPTLSALLSDADYAGVGAATVKALGALGTADSEDDDDIIAAARRHVFALAKIPAAWAALTADMDLVMKYLSKSLNLKQDAEKKEEDNLVLAIALLVFLKGSLSGTKLTPVVEKLKETEDPKYTKFVSRAKLLLAELTA